MVTSVYGDIEGHRIIFSLSEGNFWQATIPAVPTGEYVTALYCEDDEGNTTYYGTILYVVDVEKLQYEIKMLEYATDYCAEPMERYYIDSIEVSGKVAYFDQDKL